ncbi:hypothetical protein JW921_05875 [Candidatus Fermentibacterales bacterium]|nr:hypothetical protein [Candidatus Fermentibacterales bacterium]
MVGTLVFESPRDRHSAERDLLGFVVAFRNLLGEQPDEAGLHASLEDGLHCHLLWAGRDLTRQQQFELAALWSHGLVLLSHTKGNPALRENDLSSWARMIEGGGPWERLVSR